MTKEDRLIAIKESEIEPIDEDYVRTAVWARFSDDYYRGYNQALEDIKSKGRVIDEEMIKEVIENTPTIIGFHAPPNEKPIEVEQYICGLEAERLTQAILQMMGKEVSNGQETARKTAGKC
uniref:Uncharacterized protein n=1 Tax=viral metagenome TaxID=1070528 RepID=A0A6H1ZC43_9ZZZZ